MTQATVEASGEHWQQCSASGGGCHPALIIGLGGTGAAVVRRLKRLIRGRYSAGCDGLGHLCVDTDSGTFADEPGLPAQSAAEPWDIGMTRDNARRLVNQMRLRGQQPQLKECIGDKLFVDGPGAHGAGRIRACGRFCLFGNFARVTATLDQAYAPLVELSPTLHTFDRMAADRVTSSANPEVYIVSSCFGGTGAGLWLDIATLLRRMSRANPQDARAILTARGDGCVAAASPRSRFTRVPPSGAGGDTWGTIAGRAAGVDFRRTRVVIYAYGDTWYVQPWANSPYTAIHSDGTWSTRTHLGFRYTALLVGRSYRPPSTTGTLPSVSGDVLTIATAEPGRRIGFSGDTTRVKASPEPVGPGPNRFSDSGRNVWVDRRGRLDLAITRQNGRDYCAEVILERSLGYGTYGFYLDSPVNDLPDNVILGRFTWSDDPAEAHRELDVELGRFEAGPENAQYVIQPCTTPGNLVRFVWPAGISRPTHSFQWKQGEARFASRHSHNSESGELIQDHTFTEGVPGTGDETPRINYWLLGGDAPQPALTASRTRSWFGRCDSFRSPRQAYLALANASRLTRGDQLGSRAPVIHVSRDGMRRPEAGRRNIWSAPDREGVSECQSYC